MPYLKGQGLSGLCWGPQRPHGVAGAGDTHPYCPETEYNTSQNQSMTCFSLINEHYFTNSHVNGTIETFWQGSSAWGLLRLSRIILILKVWYGMFWWRWSEETYLKKRNLHHSLIRTMISCRWQKEMENSSLNSATTTLTFASIISYIYHIVHIGINFFFTWGNLKIMMQLF